MKLRNIFITGLSVLALTACNDYLEVDAPSKNFPDNVFADDKAMERAVYGLYANLLDNDTYGDKMLSAFCLNSDVDFVSNSSKYTTSNKYCRFDCDPDGNEIKKAWESMYHGIELCNLFIEGAESSPAYDKDEPDPNIIQMIGEAKVIRAIYYHDLIWMFGDVPFSFNSSRTATVKIYPVKDRTEILSMLIDDIASVADYMKPSSQTGIERVSQEMAYSMIARMALTAGGYSLRPDGDTYGKMDRPTNWEDFYKTARTYAYKVIEGNTHSLDKDDYYETFVKECNHELVEGGDPIFEIPFGVESTGNIGYIHGSKMDQYQGETPHNYGKASSSARLNALYRFSFDPDDARRNYVNQLFRYTATGSEYTAVLENSYTVMNGKWSKLWKRGGLGSMTEGNTGINYPYMRYADVLLMCAEADCVLNNGNPTDLSRDCLEKVRKRAFRNTNEMKVYTYDQSNFLKAILDERKFEFAGENMRWRDLVRNNLYSEAVFINFYRYLGVANMSLGDEEYLKDISAWEFGDETVLTSIPWTMYTVDTVENMDYDEDGNPKGPFYDESAFPNEGMKVCRILNPQNGYEQVANIKTLANSLGITTYNTVEYMKWVDGEDMIRNEVRYSQLGYIYMDESDRIYIIENGKEKIAPTLDSYLSGTVKLPEVRYILPYPRSVINRSSGQYVNKYGYK